jgi:hypothetical protein
MSRMGSALGLEELAAGNASLSKLDSDELLERWKAIYERAPFRSSAPWTEALDTKGPNPFRAPSLISRGDQLFLILAFRSRAADP